MIFLKLHFLFESIHSFIGPALCLVQSVGLGSHLSNLLDRYQQYKDEASALDSWLSAQEQNQSISKPSGEKTDTQTLQNTLSAVKVRVAL